MIKQARESLVIDKPETIQEYAKYAWEGFQMLVVGVAVLLWRAFKSVCLWIGRLIFQRRDKPKGNNTNGRTIRD